MPTVKIYLSIKIYFELYNKAHIQLPQVKKEI